MLSHLNSFNQEKEQRRHARNLKQNVLQLVILCEKHYADWRQVKEQIYKEEALVDDEGRQPLEINNFLHRLLQVKLQVVLIALEHVRSVIEVVEFDDLVLTLDVFVIHRLDFVADDGEGEVDVPVLGFKLFLHVGILLLIVFNYFGCYFFLLIMEAF